MLQVLTYNICGEGVSDASPNGFDPQRKHEEVVALVRRHRPHLLSLQARCGAGSGTLLPKPPLLWAWLLLPLARVLALAMPLSVRLFVSGACFLFNPDLQPPPNLLTRKPPQEVVNTQWCWGAETLPRELEPLGYELAASSAFTDVQVGCRRGRVQAGSSKSEPS